MKIKTHSLFNSTVSRIVAPCCVLALTSLAQAADKTWTGATNLLWDTSSANWSPSLWVNYDIAHFAATGAGSTISISGTQNANQLSFEADNYTVQGGILVLGSPSGGPSITVGTGLTATLNTTLNSAGGGANWNKAGLGTLVFGSTDTTTNRAINLNAGTLKMVTGSQITSTRGIDFLNPTGTAAAFEMTGGAYSASGSLLMGQNTTSQGTSTFTQSGGTFTVSNSGGNDFGLANWGGTSQLTVSGGTFSSAAYWGMTIGQRGTGILTISGTGSFTQTNASSGIALGGQSSGVGTVNLDGGTLTTLRLGKGSGSGTMNFNGGTLMPTAASTNFLQGLTRANVRDGGAVIDTNGVNITIGQELQHSNLGGDAATDGGLTKNGIGVLTLSAVCTFTGNTTINAGTLALSGAGSISNSPIINVQSTATLQGGAFGTGQTVQGTGTIAGTVTMASGSTLSPAGSGTIGTLTANDSLNLGGNTVMDLNKSGATLTSDAITGTGSLTYSGTLTVNATGDTLALGDTFTLFSNSGGYGGGFASYVLPSLPVGLSWDQSMLTVNGTIQVVNFVSAPFFSPIAGSYVGAQSVTITSDSGSTIYYSGIL